MEAAGSSETLVTTYQTTRRHILDDDNIEKTRTLYTICIAASCDVTILPYCIVRVLFMQDSN
jgi:hypothetical protein